MRQVKFESRAAGSEDLLMEILIILPEFVSDRLPAGQFKHEKGSKNISNKYKKRIISCKNSRLKLLYNFTDK